MKTIKKDGEIRRVSDDEAFDLTKRGWEYCPKEEWKKNVRVTSQLPKNIDFPDPTDNMSDKKKRRIRKEQRRLRNQKNK